MVSDNKILTVSYGTFSCTLEGFDDPFSTMKVIAEYFRDLSAGDRYFGAEPPQPDPSTMQRLAETSGQTRVNAQISDNGVVLRPSHGAQTPASPADLSGVEPAGGEAVLPNAVTPMLDATGPSMESVAAKLRRIRAVAAREASEDALFSEDQHAEPFLNATATDQNIEPAAPQAIEPTMPQAAAPVTDSPANPPVRAADAPQGEQADATIEDTTEPTEALPLDRQHDSGVGPANSDACPLPEVADPKPTAKSTPRRRIIVQKITKSDLEQARAQVQQASQPADIPPPPQSLSEVDESEVLKHLRSLQEPPAFEVAADDSDNADSEISEISETHVETQNETKANDTTSDDGLLDDPVASTDEIKSDPTDQEQTAAPDAQADLERALSDLDEDENEDTQHHQNTARDARRARASKLEGHNEDDIERLMSTTSSRLDHDESSARRASIAHLKAAVAATKADASLAHEAGQLGARERDQYAEDLARVVRPERAQLPADVSKTSRPAPLVLVKELQIDRTDQSDADESGEAHRPAEDVRPRRVTSDDHGTASATEEHEPNIFDGEDQTNFSDFATQADALHLPDLLEAAAAYCTFVERKEHVTRPMLMRKIAPISAEQNLTREQGLRSFGTLLRDGKLVKVDNGRFEIAESSRFAPRERYVGE